MIFFARYFVDNLLNFLNRVTLCMTAISCNSTKCTPLMNMFCCSKVNLCEKAIVRRLRTNASLSEPASFSLNRNLVLAILYAIVSAQGTCASTSHELRLKEANPSNILWLRSSDQHGSETGLHDKDSAIHPRGSTSLSHSSPMDTDGRKWLTVSDCKDGLVR